MQIHAGAIEVSKEARKNCLNLVNSITTRSAEFLFLDFRFQSIRRQQHEKSVTICTPVQVFVSVSAYSFTPNPVAIFFIFFAPFPCRVASFAIWLKSIFRSMSLPMNCDFSSLLRLVRWSQSMDSPLCVELTGCRDVWNGQCWWYGFRWEGGVFDWRNSSPPFKLNGKLHLIGHGVTDWEGGWEGVKWLNCWSVSQRSLIIRWAISNEIITLIQSNRHSTNIRWV